MLIISSTAKISKFADIEDSVRGSRIIIGDNVTIDSFVKIKPAGGMGDLEIGPGTIINSGVAIYTGNGITIGANVLIAANCVLAATSHEFRSRDLPIKEQGFVAQSSHLGRQSGIIIGDDVMIGAGSVVLEGACIGKGAVVTTGSVIKSQLVEYGIYAGTPLKCLGYRR